MSIATQAKSGTTRAGLPRSRYAWRSTTAAIRRGRSTLRLPERERLARDGDEELLERAAAVLLRQPARVALEEDPPAREEQHAVADRLHLDHVVRRPQDPRGVAGGEVPDRA